MNKEAMPRIYIGHLSALAGLLGSLSIVLWPHSPFEPHKLWMMPTLALLVAITGRFKFKVSPQGDATVLTVPLFMAVLLLHPLEAALVGVVGTLGAEALLRARREVAVFNVSLSGVTAASAGIVFWATRPELTGAMFTPDMVLAAALAGLVVHVTNLCPLFGLLTLLKGQSFWNRWRQTWVFEMILEGSLLILGLIGAQLVLYDWWWLLVLVIPFVVAYYGFRHSVEEAVQKTRLAEELDSNLKQLKETQSQLIQSAKLATVGTLAAGVAHEINNPLTIITGRAELFLARLRRSGGQVDAEKAVADMQDVYNMGMRISTIVNQLLAYSRRSDQIADVRLDKVMDDAITLLERKIEQKGVKLVREYRNAAHVHVSGVANQLQQVFVNLIGNALDATPAWGTITLGCNHRNGTAMAYVRDTGIGIPEDIKEKIFEPFFTTKEVGKGTGLGLFLCHKILSDHSGDISVDSKQGEGTTFYVSLPVAEQAEQREAVTPISAASAG